MIKQGKLDNYPKNWGKIGSFRYSEVYFFAQFDCVALFFNSSDSA